MHHLKISYHDINVDEFVFYFIHYNFVVYAKFRYAFD